MWLSDRRFVILAPLALAACGFAPLYGPGSAAAALQGAVRAAEPSDRAGFDLVARIEERLGRPGIARFDLAYEITLEPVGVGVTTDGVTTRYTLTGSVAYSLTDRANGAALHGGSVSGFTAYSATGSTVAVLEAEDDARARLMVILADQIVARLLASAADWLP